MKFAVAKEHRDFFNKNHYVEFEGLIAPNQIKEILDGIDSALSQRLSINKEQLIRQPPEKLFMTGHDLWRMNESVKRVVLNNSLAEIASQLLEQSPLRLGYDQFFPKNMRSFYRKNAYADLLINAKSLLDFSSIQGVLCGLMISLESDQDSRVVSEGVIDIFSKNTGNGIFFKPDATIDFQSLANNYTGQYLLIVYVQPASVYLFKEQDPHTHFLKGLGHVFGDRLSDRWHPIVFR